MLPEQSEMNGPIVDAQAQLNPTSEVSAVAQSPPLMEGVRHESDFRSYEGSPLTAPPHFPRLVVRWSLSQIRHGAQLTNGKEKNGVPASRTALNFADSRVPTNVMLGGPKSLVFGPCEIGIFEDDRSLT